MPTHEQIAQEQEDQDPINTAAPAAPPAAESRLHARPAWQAFLLTALSGLGLAGALPHLDWGWLAWFALVPVLACFPFANKRTAFAYGVLMGTCYLGVMAYWIIVFGTPLIGTPLATVGWALVTSYQAFYIGVWMLGAQWLRTRPSPWAWRLGVPALWAVVEWARQLGALGLSWGDLAYMQHFALPILQLTKLTGIWGLAFLIVLVNVALAEAFTRLRQRQPLGGFVPATAALVLAVFLYGLGAIRAENLHPTFVAAALQGNIDQNVPPSPAYVARVMDTFETQSREAARRGATLTVWPETAFPGYLLADTGNLMKLQAQARRERQAMVIGSGEPDPVQNKLANSVFMMNAQGAVTGSYQKRQLAPFGEFVPGVEWLPFLAALHVTAADLKAGDDTQSLLDGGPGIGKIGATICFESSYPRFLQEQVARGAGLLVISTDDTWFGRTAEVRQHTAIAAVRAAEMDRYLVRSAATGVSQVIAPTGQVLAEADLFRPAVVSAPVESRSTRTPYVRWGDWFVAFSALLLVLSVGLPALNARVRRAETFRSSDR